MSSDITPIRTTPRGYFKAQASGGNGGNCVEVNLDAVVTEGKIRLRHSKHPEVAPFEYDRTGWSAVLTGTRAGSCPGADMDQLASKGVVLLHDTTNAATPPFTFTAAEWAAFEDGVAKGEFDIATEPSVA